jgi:ankyrin repeat protein
MSTILREEPAAGFSLLFRYLLEMGADPFVADSDGNIALHWAVLSGSMNSVELLLNYGCDVNSANNIGDTPL